MSRERTIERRHAVRAVYDIVSAMRAIAAGRIQGAQRALSSARHYEEIVLRAIAACVPPDAPPIGGIGKPPLLIVLTSEQPLCGTFNQDVLALAEREWAVMREVPGANLLVVGERGRRQIEARGIAPHAGEPAATSLAGLHDLVKRLGARIERRFAADTLGPVRIVYNRYRSVSEQVPEAERLFPIDLAMLSRDYAPRATFHRYLSDTALWAGLAFEYVFISLYHAGAESFASEQASRLVAMDSATRNTQKMLDQLARLEQRERQTEITDEVLELIRARFANGGR